MKRVLCLSIVLFSIIVFIWSQYVGLTLNAQVVHKQFTVSPIQGSWIVEKYVSTGGTTVDDKKAKQLLGKVAYFRGATVEFNGNITKDVKYKVKAVDTKSYFWNTIKISAKSLGIKNVDVQIITINYNDIFFDEYVKLDESTLIKNYDGILLYYHKAKDSNDMHLYNKDKENNTKVLISKAEKEIRAKSGLLLGVRYENSKGEVGLSKYSYKTLWISSVNDKILSIRETKDLLLPRQDGFWKVGISKKIENGDSKDVLWSYPINSINPNKPINEKPKQIKYSKAEGSMTINFVGSNYVSTDTVQDLNNNDSEKKYSNNKLKIFPMDNLLGESIKLTNILPMEMVNLPGTLLNIPKNSNDEKLEKVDNNWGVIRRSGRWILRGRMPQTNAGYSFIDFDIPYATPKSLTTYDNIFPSFNVIKTKVPSAVDAYSSPNRDFVVVLTNTELMVFTIKGDNLSKNSLTLKFKAGEIPVMSEWATGRYVDEWQKKVK